MEKKKIGHPAWNKGKKLSEETKKKISKAMKGNKNNLGKHWKLKTKRKGHIVSEETKKKLSETLRKNNPMKNPKNRLRVSLAKKGKPLLKFRGRGHPNWQGGKSFEPYSVDWTETLRKAIRERDHYICQLCSQYGNVVHHIDYDKKNNNPANLITLCQKCNPKVNFNKEKWQKIFQKIE